MSLDQITLSSLDVKSPAAQEKFEEDDFSFPSTDPKKLAWLDLKEGVLAWRIWIMLALQDIKFRYKRSTLGPLWLTLSMAITVYSMGFIYSQLFKTDIHEYYPFLVSGMIAWTFISTLIIDCSEGFINDYGLIKQIKLPYSLYIHRIFARNILIFLHNIIIMVPIYIIFYNNVPLNVHTLFLLPALAILYINAFFYGLLISIMCTRYRDIPPIIKSIMQVIFFITPVMWRPEELIGKKHIIVDLNPIYTFLELIREPLLGNLPSSKNLITALVITLFGFVASFQLFSRYRKRIIYWL